MILSQSLEEHKVNIAAVLTTLWNTRWYTQKCDKSHQHTQQPTLNTLNNCSVCLQQWAGSRWRRLRGLLLQKYSIVHNSEEPRDDELAWYGVLEVQSKFRSYRSTQCTQQYGHDSPSDFNNKSKTHKWHKVQFKTAINLWSQWDRNP